MVASNKVTNTIILDELKEIRKAQDEMRERTVRVETKLDIVLKQHIDHEARLRGLEKYKQAAVGVVAAVTLIVNVSWKWFLLHLTGKAV